MNSAAAYALIFPMFAILIWKLFWIAFAIRRSEEKFRKVGKAASPRARLQAYLLALLAPSILIIGLPIMLGNKPDGISYQVAGIVTVLFVIAVHFTYKRQDWILKNKDALDLADAEEAQRQMQRKNEILAEEEARRTSGEDLY